MKHYYDSTAHIHILSIYSKGKSSINLPEDHFCYKGKLTNPELLKYDGTTFSDHPDKDTIIAQRLEDKLLNDLENLLVRKEIEILSILNNEMILIKTGYTEDEIKSWEQQRTEAIAYTADSGAAVPLITALAAAREITVAVLVTKINANVASYQTAYSASLGKKQKYSDQIETINDDGGKTTQEKIDDIILIDII